MKMLLMAFQMLMWYLILVFQQQLSVHTKPKQMFLYFRTTGWLLENYDEVAALCNEKKTEHLSRVLTSLGVNIFFKSTNICCKSCQKN
jgi:hypothetical protein